MSTARKAGLLAEIEQLAEASKPAPKCGVTLAKQNLDESDAADLDAALADQRITNAVIAKALQARGFNVADQAIARHRRGVCACGTR